MSVANFSPDTWNTGIRIIAMKSSIMRQQMHGLIVTPVKPFQRSARHPASAYTNICWDNHGPGTLVSAESPARNVKGRWREVASFTITRRRH